MIRKKTLGLLSAAALLFSSFPTHAVYLDGKYWRQPSETSGITYNDLFSSACNPTSGECIGSVKGVDVDGWTVANRQEAERMFLAAGVPVVPAGEYDSTWAPAFILDPTDPTDEGLFFATYQDSSGQSVSGILRELVAPPTTAVWVGALVEGAYGWDFANLSNTRPLNDSGSSGVWMYRVPEPSSIISFCIGLASISFSRKRTAKKRVHRKAAG